MKFRYKNNFKHNSFNVVINTPRHMGKKGRLKDGELEYLSFGVLKLNHNKKYHHKHTDEECCMVLLNGRCEIRVGGHLYRDIGPRNNVFDEKAYAVYIPRDCDYEVRASSNEMEMAVVKSHASRTNKYEPKLITPDMLKPRIVGRDNWERKVYDILDKSTPADRLLVGETMNPPGNWSSYPPHKHTLDNIPIESRHEELYYFRICPASGFGMQWLYNENKKVNETHLVRHDDVMVLSRGYHPVVAAPGYKLYYLWALAGKKRTLVPHDDPQHAWIKED